MEVVVGHKQLNLDELYKISLFGNKFKVIVDSQTFSALANGPAKDEKPKAREMAGDFNAANLSEGHKRAILLLKLVQLLKLKKAAKKDTVNFIIGLLNDNAVPAEGQFLN